MYRHDRIGDINGLNLQEIQFLENFSFSEFNDGSKINQYTGMPPSFSDLLEIEDEFPDLTEGQLSELKDIEKRAINSSTEKQTKCVSDEFKKFLLDCSLPNQIENIPARYLCEYMRLWFSEMKRKDGEAYSLSTLACKRAAIHRYILETTAVV